MSLDTTPITFSFKSEDGSIYPEAIYDILGIKRINHSTTGTIGSWNISSDTDSKSSTSNGPTGSTAAVPVTTTGSVTINADYISSNAITTGSSSAISPNWQFTPNTITTNTYKLDESYYNNLYFDYNNVYKELKKMKEKKAAHPINITTRKSNSATIYISDVEILVPNKVVKVTIEKPLMAERKFSYKQVCKDPDTFDLRFAIALGIVKHFEKVEQAFPHPLTNYGREVKAREFCDIYDTTSRAIDQAIRAMKKKEAAKEKFEKEKAEIKAIKERRREKNRKKREKRKEKLQLVRLVKE